MSEGAEQFKCQECGKKFKTTKSAERAARRGCKCGSVDIDVDTDAGERQVQS